MQRVVIENNNIQGADTVNLTGDVEVVFVRSNGTFKAIDISTDKGTVLISAPMRADAIPQKNTFSLQGQKRLKLVMETK